MSFLIPILGIALGFDAVNKEFSQKTLGRILSQPIFRDVLLFAKALGALGALAIMLLSLFLIVIGSGMLIFGVPPTTEQIGRALVFYIITLLYAGIWYIIAMFFSITYKQGSTSAFLSIALWLFLMIFWSPISELIAYNVSGNQLTALNIYSMLSNISPYILFNKASIAILRPTTRSLGPVMFYQMEGAISGSPLPLSQSLLLIWPQITEFIAVIILIFTLGYIKFQRKEIRM
jgi:ABC-2 type transport system permease protein